jgi:hypothetical protein
MSNVFRSLPATTRSVRPTTSGHSSVRNPVFQAFWLLRLGFFVLPLVFGLDKFFNLLTYWPKYLWIGFPHLLNIAPQHFMDAVGVIEIVAGVSVLLRPRHAAYVVATWLAAIITNLIIISAASGHARYWDVALRDFGLLIAAVALARIATAFHQRAVGARIED